MKLHRWNVAGVLFAAAVGVVALGAGGCTATATGSVGVGPTPEPSISVFPGCSADTSLGCEGTSLGITCPTGTQPDSSQYYCSEPASDGAGNDNYCCITWSGGSDCAIDDSVDCSASDSWGFTCTGTDSPDVGDPTLVCSVPGGTGTQFCCTDGTTVVTGGSSGGGSGGGSGGTMPTCAADSSLTCDAGSTGYTCTGGAVIGTDDPTFICSDPTAMQDGTNGQCCITTFTDSSCQADSSLQCEEPSIGFSCATGDNPMDSDPTLNCSVPAGDSSGDHFLLRVERKANPTIGRRRVGAASLRAFGDGEAGPRLALLIEVPAAAC